MGSTLEWVEAWLSKLGVTDAKAIAANPNSWTLFVGEKAISMAALPKKKDISALNIVYETWSYASIVAEVLRECSHRSAYLKVQRTKSLITVSWLDQFRKDCSLVLWEEK